MTSVDMARPPALPARRRGWRLAVGIVIALLLVVAGGASYYYDSVRLVEPSVSYPVVPVAELPPPVAQVFVAAIDPDFYESSNSLITRRYVDITSGAGKKSRVRSRIMANKAESTYAKEDILDRYLNRADYGRGAVGLVAAAQTYFHKPAAQLTVAEAALLAVQLHPNRLEPEAGWARVLDIMVERGWLTPAERNRLTFPG